jgi:YVTN family beta-propeller protein
MARLTFFVLLWLVIPSSFAFAELHSLVVLSRDDHAIHEINPSSGQTLKQVKLAGAPREAIFSWDEKTLFVTVPDAAHVAIIDLQKFAQTGQITHPAFKRPNGGSPGAPFGLANSSDGQKLYIGIEGGLVVYDQRLLVLNPEWRQEGRTITVPAKDGRHFKVQGTTDKLYYPHRQENQVVVVDTKNDTVVKTIPVPGGPLDVAFVPGNEVWVQAEDGTIAVIDSSKDVVKQTISTGGKGTGRIAIAPDIRFVASTHAESGEVTVLHPLEKKVLGKMKIGSGPATAEFVPAAKGASNFTMKDPTTSMYVAGGGSSEIAVVSLDSMNVEKKHKVGHGLVGSLIRYRFAAGFTPPREGTAKRVMETDLFTARLNAMTLYDVSPVHEHREDMVGFFISSGVYKAGCWLPDCGPEATGPSLTNPGPGGLPYINAWAEAGLMTGVTRGTLHVEEGGSPSPRRMLTFDMKNNYYRQTRPPKASLLEKTVFRKFGESPRAIAWDVMLKPGDKPVLLPEGDFVVVYMNGGLFRKIRNGKPEIVNRYYNEFDWEPQALSIESLTNAVRVVVLEFK